MSPGIKSTSVLGSGTWWMKGGCLANGSCPMPTGGGPAATMMGGVQGVAGVEGTPGAGAPGVHGFPSVPPAYVPGWIGEGRPPPTAGLLTPMIGVNIERARLVVELAAPGV